MAMRDQAIDTPIEKQALEMPIVLHSTNKQKSFISDISSPLYIEGVLVLLVILLAIRLFFMRRKMKRITNKEA